MWFVPRQGVSEKIVDRQNSEVTAWRSECIYCGHVHRVYPMAFNRTWKDECGNEILHDTNKHCERAIGWWIKERYRSMRSYKLEQSVLGVHLSIALAGNHRVR